MAVNKSKFQTFTQQWDKTVQWAKQNNIPYSAYYPIYQADSQKLLSTSSPMSESERIRAIQSAAGLNAVTALPTDKPNPADVPTNIKTDAGNIFTGLEGVFTGSFEKNIWDTLTNTVEHPSSIYGAFDRIPTPWESSAQSKQYLANLSNHIQSQHNALGFVPGAQVFAELQHPGGVGNVLSHPITSLLDVLPLGRTFPHALANTTEVDEAGLTLGDRWAQKLGVTKEQLGKMDGIQLLYRMGKTIRIKGQKTSVIRDAVGNPVDIKPATIGERIDNYRGEIGTASSQADAIQGIVMKSEKGTNLVEQKLTPVDVAFNALNDEQRTIALKAIADDHRPESEILNDERYPAPVLAALQATFDYGKQALDLRLQSGAMVSIETPFGVENYVADSTVPKAKAAAERQQIQLDKAGKPFDALSYRIDLSDEKMQGAFDAFEQQTAAIYGSIKRTIPELGEKLSAQLRATLPTAERWDRAVAEQTPLLKNLLGLGPEDKLTLHHVNALRDLFAPGGLRDQMTQAAKDQDWSALVQYSGLAMKKFNLKVFDKIPTDQNQFLNKAKLLTAEIHKYAVQRNRDVARLTRMLWGHNDPARIAKGQFTRTSLIAQSKKTVELHNKFVETAIKHPPGIWVNTYLTKYVDALMNQRNSAELVEAAGKALVKKGYEPTVVEKLMTDPRTIIELVVRSAKNTLENNMMPDIEYGAAKRAADEAYHEVALLRAKGPEYAPAWVPAISPHDVVRGLEGGYNVYIGSIVPKSVSATFERAFDFTSSVYDVQLAIRKDALEEVTRDVTQEYVDEYVMPHLDEGGPLREVAAKYRQHEIQAISQQGLEEGVRQKSVDAIIDSQLRDMGKIKINPHTHFGTFSTNKLMDAEYYIDKNLLDAIDAGMTKFQFPAQGFLEKGTKLFRFSILQMSPRFTAHVLVGGTALVAYRGHPSMLTQLRGAWHVANSGALPPEVLAKTEGFASAPRQVIRDYRIARKNKHQEVMAQIKQRYPNIEEHMVGPATQEGAADVLFHKAAGYTGGNKLIQETMDKHDMARTMYNWSHAALMVNTRFTRLVVRMQRALVYLDGGARAYRRGSFNELVAVPTLDEHGKQLINPTTGKPIFHQEERQSEMTPQQAHEEGMRATLQVMGDLRHMTPLERNWAVKIFPFYGWTKHVLTYVMTYPIDHPYRAMILSQFAEQQSADVPSGLPTRIQLLFFLGQPDAFGNVSAVDARVFDPLRDTANYASTQGFFQSLNPIFSAPVAYLDPNAVYGANELYPKVTYNQLYGVKEAGPQGNPYTVAEQFVPELTAVDEAFNLSGQYGYLKSTNPEAFSKKIFQSLNVPFFQVQHINLRQIAAANEIDRYNQAYAAGQTVAKTGDPTALSGYPENAQIPDPLNPYYNVTPAYIEAMSKQSEDTYGLPYYETAVAPRTPPL